MAWITKQSASEKIELRDEPYLTDAMQKELREEYLPRFETSLGALLPALHMIQHHYGWVPKQAMMEIAEWTPPVLLSLGAQAANGQVNTIITNVPGPQFPLYMLGARLRRMIPMPPLDWIRYSSIVDRLP